MTAIQISRSSFLTRVPISVFGIGMGVLGLGLCWRNAARLFDLSAAIGDSILAVGSALSLLALASQLWRALLAPRSLREELLHPVRGPAVAQPVVVLLLIAEAVGRDWPLASHVLLIVGSALALFVTLQMLFLFARCRISELPVAPTWLIAPIALLIAAILHAGEGNAVAAWLLMVAGAGTILGLRPVTLLYFPVATLPEPARPLVMISVAPLALIFIAYVELRGIDVVALALFGGALAILLRAVATLPTWRKAPFGLPWWSCAMPPAAFVLAILVLADKVRGDAMQASAAMAVGTFTCAMALLFVNTGRAIVGGRFFPPAN